MERREQLNQPSGSRSGQRNRPSASNPSFLFPRDQENQVNRNSNPNFNPNLNRPILNRNGLVQNNQHNILNRNGVVHNDQIIFNRNGLVQTRDRSLNRIELEYDNQPGNFDWRDPLEPDITSSSSDDCCSYSFDSTSTSSSEDEMRAIDERNVAENRGRPVFLNTYVGYGLVGFPHIYANYSIAGLLGPPGLGLGLPLRLNGSNVHDFGRHSYQGVDVGSNATVRHRMDDDFANIHGPGVSHGRNDSGVIFYYTMTTAYAHLRRNGEGLSEMLSLRHPHVFNIMHAHNYVVPINQICNNIDLAQAMIFHLDCVRALLARNMGLALTSQIACVNAVLRLLNYPYSRPEDWTYPVINTVYFELRIINARVSPAGPHGQIVMHYDWLANNLACFFHPEDCPCHQPRMYRSRHFYRRF